MLTRREFGTAVVGASVVGRVRLQADPKALRGVFIILTTPFTARGDVDWEDLARETTFCDRCGVRGVVWPQGSSGVANLTKAERLRGMQVLADAARGSNASLVLGVQGRDTAEMLEYAHAAEALAP